MPTGWWSTQPSTTWMAPAVCAVIVVVFALWAVRHLFPGPPQGTTPSPAETETVESGTATPSSHRFPA